MALHTPPMESIFVLGQQTSLFRTTMRAIRLSRLVLMRNVSTLGTIPPRELRHFLINRPRARIVSAFRTDLSSHIFLLPNVPGQPRPRLARGVRKHDT